MSHNIILAAATILDNISSGNLTQGEFYFLMEESGTLATELCVLAIRNELTHDFLSVVRAADCLRDISIAEDNNKLETALKESKNHAKRLYQIFEMMR